MVRRYDDAVQVRTTDGTAGGAGKDHEATPTAFVWRGRPYVVREVLAHWYERRAWWHATGAGAEPPAEPPAGPTRADAVAAEREVWRVEAAGRSGPVGVYHLTRHPGDGPAARWLLTRLDD